MTNERKIHLQGDTERHALIHALDALAGLTATAGVVADDDAAAATGTAVNIVDHGDGYAHLESTLAGAADTTFEIGAGGPTVTVTHAAAPGGVQLYFDEDGAAPKFIANLPSGAAVFLVASDGRLVKVGHDATPNVEGVAVYCDDDAANEHEKLLFVSPTNADGAFSTDITTFSLTLDLEQVREPDVRPQFTQEADASITLAIVAA